MSEPVRAAEFVIEPLRLDPVHGWEFYVTCDVELHEAIRTMAGVKSVCGFESGRAIVQIDPRYTAHDVYVYVGCQLTRLTKTAQLERMVSDAIEQGKNQ